MAPRKTAASPPAAASPTSFIAVGSGKGGTGKTTIVAGLAFAFANDFERRVAVVDLDPQASLTRVLGARAVKNPLEAAAVDVHGIQLLRGGFALAQASEEELRQQIDRGLAEADLLLVDMRPTLEDAGTRAVLRHPRAFLLVTPLLGPESMPEANKLMALASAANVPYRILGNGFRRRRTATNALQYLRTGHGSALLQTTVPDSADVPEAHERGLPTTAFRPRTNAARSALLAVAEELMADGVV